MKKILSVVALLLAVASQAMAAFESVKFSPVNVIPGFPAKLVLDGVTEGHVVFAVSISAEGRLTDTLALAYTHEPLVQACRLVMKNWQVTPARFDGQNVPVQMELRFDFKREGVVETNNVNVVNYLLYGRFPGLAEKLAYRLPRQSELDRSPTPVTKIEPLYAKQAKQEGVTGKVRVYFYIDEKGEVRLPCVDSTSHPYLSDIAVTALRSWRFDPATSRGQPVMVAASQQFDFGAN